MIATLALAAGLNAAVFGILDATLLRPLPYPDERALVSVANSWTDAERGSVSLPEFEDFRTRARAFASMAALSNTSINLASNGATPERIQGLRATASLFDVLGVSPALGRPFTADEDVRDVPVVVLSHNFWARRFGANPAVIGQPLATDGGVREIIGVMPRGFDFPAPTTDVILPMNLVPGTAGGRGAHSRQVIARLAPGVSLQQASQEMQAIAGDLRRTYPDSYPPAAGYTIVVESLRESLVGEWRDGLQLLMTAVLFVLLIACANVANLLLARARDRHQETAMQVALGASRGRLVRQALAEGVLTGAGGGLAGVLVAAALMRAIGSQLPTDLPRPEHVMNDTRTILFALVVTALAGGLTAAFTALRATRLSTVDALKGARVTAEARRARTVLTMAQVALAVLLLACGGFAMRSFARLIAIDPGVRTDNVVTARVSLSSARYPDGPSRWAFFSRVQEKLRQLPGVEASGAISLLPLTSQMSDWTFGVEGYTPPASASIPDEQTRIVQGDYFKVFGIPLHAGRLFADGDTAEAPAVAIVSELLAKKYWPGLDPVGRRIKLGSVASKRDWITVVGVVGDIRYLTLADDPAPILYLPAAQVPESGMTVLARLSPGQRRGPQLIADAVRAVDPEQPTWSPKTMEQWLSASVAEPRFGLILLGIFAALAVVLALVGVYGIMSFAVASRRRELGIRLALGAHPGSLRTFVLREAVWLTAAGIVLGGAGAIAGGRYLGTLFPDVRIADPVVLAGVPLFVLVVAICASYLPARRATLVDPVRALRAD
jgi:predicted permease